jgi:hypothetical protein
MEVDLSKKKELGENDTLDFGKYKGWKIRAVMMEEPSILIWYQNKIEWFELEEDLLIRIEEMCDARRQLAARPLNFNDDDDDDDDDAFDPEGNEGDDF